MIVEDAWGCPLTVPDERAGPAVERLVDSYYRFAPDLVGDLRAAVATGAPLARCFEGYAHVLSHRAEGWAQARLIHAALAAEAPAFGRREQRHIEALGHWSHGELAAAQRCWEDLLAEQPTEPLALRLGHFVLFNAGELGRMAAAVEAARSAWSADAPRRSYLDGMAAFAAEERGDLASAERWGRAAVEADGGDLWSIHAVAHVFEMSGRTSSGRRWIDERTPAIEAGGSFSNHLWWHRALYALAAGDHDEVLDLYDRRIYAGESQEGLDVTNAVAMLARLEVRGVDCGARWAALAPACRARWGHHSHPFNDCHFALGLAYGGEPGEAADFVASMQAWSDGHHDDAALVLRGVGLGVARGCVAYAERDHVLAARELGLVTAELRWLGGSHAQRDVFRQLRVDAERRAAPGSAG